MIAKAIEKRSLVRVKSAWMDPDESLCGYPLQQSRSLVLVQEIVDFHLDGYRILRHRDIEDVKTYGPNHEVSYVATQEGCRDGVGIDKELKLSSLPAVLRDLKERKKLVILDFDYDPDPYLWLGTLVRRDKKSGKCRFLDVDARWDRRLRTFDYDDVSRIPFDDGYSLAYARHARPAKTKRK